MGESGKCNRKASPKTKKLKTTNTKRKVKPAGPASVQGTPTSSTLCSSHTVHTVSAFAAGGTVLTTPRNSPNPTPPAMPHEPISSATLCSETAPSSSVQVLEDFARILECEMGANLDKVNGMCNGQWHLFYDQCSCFFSIVTVCFWQEEIVLLRCRNQLEEQKVCTRKS